MNNKIFIGLAKGLGISILGIAFFTTMVPAITSLMFSMIAITSGSEVSLIKLSISSGIIIFWITLGAIYDELTKQGSKHFSTLPSLSKTEK